MDSANAQSWPGMDAAADQDFGSLIDFDHFNDLDLPDFHNIAFTHPGPQNATLADALDPHHLDHPFSPHVPQDPQDPQNPQSHGDRAPSGAQQGQGQGQGNTGTHGMPQPSVNASFFDYGMSHFTHAGTPVFSQPADHVFRPHHGVPPTPNSVEMHGDPHRYMQHMDQQALYDQRYHLRKDDASFTPLVSPAVTPHDARFQIPDFTVPGAYFSPLTSPALNAQPHQHAHSQLHSHASTSASSTGHSPIDVDMDMLGEPAMVQPAEQRRSLRTKRNPPRAAPANRVRQSPIVKPGRRKPTVSMQLPPKEVSELMQEARNNGLDVPRSRDHSETDSISPEPMLSDMRPPPLPASVTHSPAMAAQNGQGTAPATPASLMRIHPSPQFDASMNVPPMLEDLALPEASLDSRPSLSRIDTAFRDGEHEYDTPRMSARKTPKMGPLSTPGAAISNRPSPMLDPMSTPTSPAFSMTSGKKLDPKQGRNAKKRGSVSSSLVSPALRPKISPSIKPLLAAGENGVSDNTHALLLASKSNYQNILDGTTVPGVSYPASLSTNLTSKRTSHKIAEQGRRNRINTALQEMQDLLPPSSQTVTPDAKSPETAAQSNNSKAAKVESAIDYIKQLKSEVSAKDELLQQKDAEMEALRKQLAELRRSSSAGVSSSGSSSENASELKKEPASTPAAVDET